MSVPIATVRMRSRIAIESQRRQPVDGSGRRPAGTDRRKPNRSHRTMPATKTIETRNGSSPIVAARAGETASASCVGPPEKASETHRTP